MVGAGVGPGLGVGLGAGAVSGAGVGFGLEGMRPTSKPPSVSNSTEQPPYSRTSSGMPTFSGLGLGLGFGLG